MSVLWITAGLSFAASFAGKLLADRFLHGRFPIIGSFAGLEYSLNPGVAFSIMLPPAIQIPVTLAALALLSVVALRTAKTRLNRTGFGLIIGGALGNIADRLVDGKVTDFFQVGTFPIFNVADSCITIGVCVLLAEMILQRLAARAKL